MSIFHPEREVIEGISAFAGSLKRSVFKDLKERDDFAVFGKRSAQEIIRLEVKRQAELNLPSERQRQARNYIALDFHKELGLSVEEYLKTLPEFEKQPPEYLGRLDMPILVETRIPWLRQADLAGIPVCSYLRENSARKGSSKTSAIPYMGWFNAWEERFEKITAADAVKQLEPDETGGGLFEGVAVQILHPEFTEQRKEFDLIGDIDIFGSGLVPSLRRRPAGPGFAIDYTNIPSERRHPLAFGEKIATRQLLAA